MIQTEGKLDEKGSYGKKRAQIGICELECIEPNGIDCV